MQRRDFLKGAAALGLAGSLFPVGWTAAADTKKPQKVLYFTRNCGYYHSVVQRTGDALSHSEKALVKMGKQVGIEVTCSNDGRIFDEDISRFDAFAFYCNNDLTEENGISPPMSQDGKKKFMDAVAAGKGFIGFHSSCACWRTDAPQFENSEPDKLDPFIKMIGAEFVKHGPQQVATMKIVSPLFPGMKGLGDSFSMKEEWYAMKNFAPDMHVIMVQETEGMEGDCYQRPPFPSTWARMQGEGRVYFTSMAHLETVWDTNPFQQIVLGGMAWALKNVDADIPANIKEVTPGAMTIKS